MANGIRTGDLRGFNKGRGSKFCVDSRVRQTPEESRRIYWPKHCRNNNGDEDNSPKTINDKNHQALSEKFRQLMVTMLRSRDGIHRGPASFWCIIHVPESVIISVLKKKAFIFLLPLVVSQSVDWRKFSNVSYLKKSYKKKV